MYFFFINNFYTDSFHPTTDYQFTCGLSLYRTIKKVNKNERNNKNILFSEKWQQISQVKTCGQCGGDIKEKLTKDGQQALNPTLSLMLMTLKGCME